MAGACLVCTSWTVKARARTPRRNRRVRVPSTLAAEDPDIAEPFLLGVGVGLDMDVREAG